MTVLFYPFFVYLQDSPSFLFLSTGQVPANIMYLSMIISVRFIFVVPLLIMYVRHYYSPVVVRPVFCILLSFFYLFFFFFFWSCRRFYIKWSLFSVALFFTLLSFLDLPLSIFFFVLCMYCMNIRLMYVCYGLTYYHNSSSSFGCFNCDDECCNCACTYHRAPNYPLAAVLALWLYIF